MMDQAAAIARAVQALLAAQQVRGHWQGPLEAHANMEAELIFLHRLLGRDEGDLDRRLADRLLELQRPDGGWPLGPGARGDLSVAIEAYYALRLAGHAAAEPVLVRAREFVLAGGGLAAAAVSTRLWLALFGQYPWVGVPAFPVEMVLLPPWSPLNIYALASWMRTAIVPAALLLAHRDAIVVRDAPAVSELWVHPPRPGDLGFARSPELVTWRNAFLALERALRAVAGSPWEPLRRRAVARAIEWLLRHQDAHGQWGGNLPATVYALLALHAVGFAPDHPVMVSGLAGAHDFLIEQGQTLIAQPALSATHDTALAVRALLDAGLDPAHPALGRAADWLLGAQIFRPGDWAVARPALDPGGWSGGSANDWYPETAASAEVLAVLAALPVAGTPAGRRALAYGLNWTLGMQSRAGGWAVCDPDGPAGFLAELPFAEGETVTDGPTADVTGQVLSLLAVAGFGPGFGRARQACTFLRRTQGGDGGWSGRSGPVHATWCALAGLAAMNDHQSDDQHAGLGRRAVEWLLARQHADGGWHEPLPAGDTAVASSPTHTAWAILALLAAGGEQQGAVERGVAWLVGAQAADGTWEERTGTAPGFGRCPAHRQQLAAVCYPLMALGRYRARAPGAAPAGHAGGSD